MCGGAWVLLLFSRRRSRARRPTAVYSGSPPFYIGLPPLIMPSKAEKAMARRLLAAAQRGDVARVRQLLDDAAAQGSGKPGQAASSDGTPHDLGGGGRDAAAGAAAGAAGGSASRDAPGVQRLLAAVDGEGATALHRAARDGHAEVCAELVAAGADVDARSAKYKTPLMEAAAGGHVHCMTVLCDAGARIESHKTNAWTPCMYAAHGGHTEALVFLFGRGDPASQVADTNKENATALYLAAREGHVEVCQMLLSAGADPNAATITDRVPLHCAVMNGHVGVIETLLAKGARFDVSDKSGTTLWHEAAARGHAALVGVFNSLSHTLASIEHLGVDDTSGRRGPLDIVGRHPVHAAALNGHVDFLRMMLESDPSLVDVTDSEGCTPLYYAAGRGHTEALKLLISAGADVRKRSLRRTPLHAAAIWDQAACVALLLDAGADTAVVDADGRTPREAALSVKKMAAVAALDARSPEGGAGDANGAWRIEAARPGHIDGIMKVVNAAYRVEIGETGLAFKNCDRYVSRSDVEASLTAGPCFVAAQVADAVDGSATTEGQKILGCICCSIVDGGRTLTYGPLAVDPALQGRGIGSALMKRAEDEARAAGCRQIEIEVVNHRADLLAFYPRHGYVVSKEMPFDHGNERLTRPSKFIIHTKAL